MCVPLHSQYALKRALCNTKLFALSQTNYHLERNSEHRESIRGIALYFAQASTYDTLRLW